MDTIRVLYAEDDPADRELTTRRLARHAPHVKLDLAPTVSEALDKLEAGAVDLVLSDFRLPDGTGWDLMQELSATKPVRAIAISGHNTDVDIERSRKVGFLDHIAKPLVAEELTAAIERAVTKPRPTGAPH